MRNRILLCAAVLGGAVAAVVDLGGQASAQLGAAPISHVGVVVRDVAAATKHFADVMGVQAPQILAVSLALPDNRKVDLRYATVQLPNLLVEFEQPVTAAGPLYEHLQKIGQSIHHIGVVANDGLDGKRAFLEQKGGKWVAGTKGGSYAFVDLKDKLGTTIEIVQGTWPPSAAPAAVDPATPAPLGLRAVSHIGIAVTNTDDVAKAWSDILGVPPPTVHDYKDNQYPPGHPWSMDAYVLLAIWKHANVGVELLGVAMAALAAALKQGLVFADETVELFEQRR